MAVKYLLFALLALITCISCRQNWKSEANVAYQALTTEENQKWVDENLERVMEAKTFEASNKLKMPYRIFANDAHADQKLPLLIHLHGRGERGTDNNTKIFNNIPLFNGEHSIVSPNMQHKYPCVVLVPQCSDKTINEEWAKWVGNSSETPWEGLGKDGSYTMAEMPSESGAAALELIEEIVGKYNIDTKRIYITGLSMGGFGTWEFIGRKPNLFAAAVPMAGYSDPSTVDKIKHIPIWIFHGDIDQWNPVQGSRNMFELLKNADANVHYTEYPNTSHGDAFQKAWKDGALIDWIFGQTK